MFVGEKRKMTFEGCMNWKARKRQEDQRWNDILEKDLKWCGLNQVDKDESGEKDEKLIAD